MIQKVCLLVIFLFGSSLQTPGECRCPRGGVPSQVCGSDGKTYWNSCLAECKNVTVSCQEECPCPTSSGTRSKKYLISMNHWIKHYHFQSLIQHQHLVNVQEEDWCSEFVGRMEELTGMNVWQDVRIQRWSVEENVPVAMEEMFQEIFPQNLKTPHQLQWLSASVRDGRGRFVAKTARPTSMIARPGVPMLILNVMEDVHVGAWGMKYPTCSMTTMASLFPTCGMLSWLTFNLCRGSKVEIKLW